MGDRHNGRQYGEADGRELGQHPARLAALAAIRSGCISYAHHGTGCPCAYRPSSGNQIGDAGIGWNNMARL
jgi:hypothetical protein